MRRFVPGDRLTCGTSRYVPCIPLKQRGGRDLAQNPVYGLLVHPHARGRLSLIMHNILWLDGHGFLDGCRHPLLNFHSHLANLLAQFSEQRITLSRELLAELTDFRCSGRLICSFPWLGLRRRLSLGVRLSLSVRLSLLVGLQFLGLLLGRFLSCRCLLLLPPLLGIPPDRTGL